MIEEYKTTDINLAANLKLAGFKMLEIIKQGNKGIFIFENVSRDFLTKFDLGQSLVEPVSFNNTIKQLTTSVRRMQNSG